MYTTNRYMSVKACLTFILLCAAPEMLAIGVIVSLMAGLCVVFFLFNKFPWRKLGERCGIIKSKIQPLDIQTRSRALSKSSRRSRSSRSRSEDSSDSRSKRSSSGWDRSGRSPSEGAGTTVFLCLVVCWLHLLTMN